LAAGLVCIHLNEAERSPRHLDRLATRDSLHQDLGQTQRLLPHGSRTQATLPLLGRCSRSAGFHFEMRGRCPSAHARPLSSSNGRPPRCALVAHNRRTFPTRTIGSRFHNNDPALGPKAGQPGLVGAHPAGDTGRTNQSEPVTDAAPGRIQLSYTPK